MKILSARRRCMYLLVLLFGLGLPVPAQQGGALPIEPTVGGAQTVTLPTDVTTSLQILFLMTVLALLPALVLMMTSFIRISIVLGLLRRALGTQQSPSNQILLGMSIFLTIFVMAPTFQEMHKSAIAPYLENPEDLRLLPGDLDEYGRESDKEVLPFIMMVRRALVPIRGFMMQQIGIGDGVKDVAFFMSMAKMSKPDTPADVPTHILIPAFMVSELKKAFTMGFVLFIPFMIVDIVVASILISMGMFQLPPAFLSLPFKILLFVLADGWSTVIKAIGLSFLEIR